MKVFPMANRTPAASRSAARRSKAAPAPAPEAASVSPPLPEPAPEPAIETEVVVETPVAEIEADSAPLPEIKLGKKKDKKKDKKKEKKVKKEAVLIRFEDSQLAAIDIQAEALGLSRAAWVRMVVAKALAVG